MSKKKTTADREEPQVPTAPVADETRSKSRHKPRRMISVSPKVYDLLATLARRHGRPINWQARIALERLLIEEGLMKPAEATYLRGDEDE